MTLEPGLTALGEVEWELGGITLDVSEDEGLDDLSELEGEDSDLAGDGSTTGQLRLAARPIGLTVPIQPDSGGGVGIDAAFTAQLNALRQVLSRQPDERATQLLRWRRAGEPAKRIYVRPAVGKPLQIPGDLARIKFSHAEAKVRLTAPLPTVLSDEYHSVTFATGETKTIVNAGTFTGLLPTAWWLTSASDVSITNAPRGEAVYFPSTGGVTVSVNREIVAPGTYGLCYGAGGTLFPRWPLLYPGNNTITASRACTFSWRDTW